MRNDSVARFGQLLTIDTEQAETLVHSERGKVPLPAFRPQSWQLGGKCIELGTTFFEHVDEVQDPQQKADCEVIAKYICNTMCPVLDICLPFAIKKGLTGVRGGMTEAERAEYAEKHGMNMASQPEAQNRIIDLR